PSRLRSVQYAVQLPSVKRIKSRPIAQPLFRQPREQLPYRGNHFRDAVRSKGGTLRVAATSMWGHDKQETLARLKAWNDAVHRTRGRIEKIFGTWKRSYGLRRMRWRGLAKAAIQIHVTAIAYNLRRTLNILAVAS
ncbi:transposase, partial [Brytella acorum]